MITSPSQLEILPDTGDSLKQTKRFHLEYVEFMRMAEKRQQWGQAHVVTICENLVESRKALFGPEQILESGLHQLEFAEIQKIAQKIEYLSDPEKSLVWASVAFAFKAHALQQRKTGAPYSVHICAVVQTLASQKLDAVTLAAGALHDTVEDCTSVNDRAAFITLLRTVFGDSVVEPVNFVTKIQDVRKLHVQKGDETEWINHLYATIEMVPRADKTASELIDELYRLQLITSLMLRKNPETQQSPIISSYERSALRALLVKLADRLHNMQTLGTMSPESKEKNSRETREIYVRLAQKFGLWDLATQLADLSTLYLATKAEVSLLPQYQALVEKLKNAPPPQQELREFLLPGLSAQPQIKTQLIIPSAAAMLAAGEPFVTLDMAVPAHSLEQVARVVTEQIKTHFGHMKRFSFSELETVMELIKSKTLATYSFFVPTPAELDSAVKQLRISISSETTSAQENTSILSLLQPEADAGMKQQATHKWLEIQATAAQHREKFSKLFKTFTSAELLLALTQRVPVGMMLVIGAPPVTRAGVERPKVPWLLPQTSTIAEYIQSISSLKHKKIKGVMVNGIQVTDYSVSLMPFDEVTVTPE